MEFFSRRSFDCKPPAHLAVAASQGDSGGRGNSTFGAPAGRRGVPIIRPAWDAFRAGTGTGGRFHFERDRRDFVARRSLLRRILGL